LEKIMTDRGLKIGSIAGTDDQINQQGNISSPTPQPVTIPFTFTVSDANYSSVQQLVTALQNSIRPMVIDTLTLTGGASSMSINATAHTYFQPAKNVKISTQVIK
jgi:nicotinamidase-related amidase